MKGIRITKDGREICSRYRWSIRRLAVGADARWLCERCGRSTGDEGECHHKIKRGMGGGFRDDRLENLEWLCRECHQVEELSGNRTKMRG